MKNHRGTAYRAVAYVTSAVMIAQALLSPLSSVYANVSGDVETQQEAVTQATEPEEDGVSTETSSDSASANSESSQGDSSTAEAATQSSSVSSPVVLASDVGDGYNPNADPIVIDNSTDSSAVKVDVGLYKDAEHKEPLGDSAVGVNESVYANVHIEFDGSIEPSKSHPNIKYVFPDGISVADNSGTVVKDGKAMYTWSISGNVFSVQFTEAFFEEHNSEIYTKADFDFTLNADKVGDDGKLDVTFPGTGTTVTIKQKEGNVSGNKSYELSADGKTVSYTIDLNPETNVTDFKLVDTLGDNLSFKGDFKLDGESITPSVDGQKATIRLDKLSKGNHKITYTAAVNQDALDALKPGANGDASLGSIGNKASWSWTGNPAGNTSETAPSIKYDLMCGKSASDTKDGSYEWTVNINTGSLKADMDGYTFKDALQNPDGMQYTGDYKVIDVTDGGKEVASGALDASKDSFSYTFGKDAKAHEYKIVYSTTMKDGAAFGEYKNDATITDKKGDSDKATGSVNYKPGTSVDIEKKQTGLVDADGYATWQVTIGLSKLAAGCDITKATFTDVPGFGYNEGANAKDNIWFPDDGELALTTATGKKLEAGKDYTATWANKQSEWNSDAQKPEDKNWGLKIVFTKEMQDLVGNTDVVLTYRTKCSGAEGTY